VTGSQDTHRDAHFAPPAEGTAVSDAPSIYRARKVGLVQNALTSAERGVYDGLWRIGTRSLRSETSLPWIEVTVGLKKLRGETALALNSCRNGIRGLIEKKVIDVLQEQVSETCTGRTYRVYSFDSVRSRWKGANLEFIVMKRGGGRKFCTIDGNEIHGCTEATLPIGPERSTDAHKTTSIEPPPPGTNFAPGTKQIDDGNQVQTLRPPDANFILGANANFASQSGIKFAPHSALFSASSSSSTSSSIDSAAVYTCFANYAPMVDQEAVARLINSSITIAPDLTTDELLAALREKGSHVTKLRQDITNPVGFLLSVVPKCFHGTAFTLWRQRRKEALRLERLENAMCAKREALDAQLRNVPSDNPWESIRTCLGERIDLHTYQTWLVPLRYVRINGRQLILAAPTDEFLAVAMRFEEDILTEIDNLNLPIDSVALVTLQELIDQAVAN
jgi:hypothetical protein